MKVDCLRRGCFCVLVVTASAYADGPVRIGFPLVGGDYGQWVPAVAAALADRVGRERGFEVIGTDALGRAASAGTPAAKIGRQCDVVVVTGLYSHIGGLNVVGAATVVGRDGRVLGVATGHGSSERRRGYRELADSLGRRLAARLRSLGSKLTERQGDLEAWGHFVKACAHLHAGGPEDPSRARRELELAVAKEPDMPYAWKLMVEAEWLVGEDSKSLLESFDRVQDPASDPRWGALLSQIMSDTASVSRTGSLYRVGKRASQDLPDSVDVYFSLGRALMDVGHTEEALDSLQRALMLSLAAHEGRTEPQVAKDILYVTGRAYEYRGDRARACACFAEAVLLGWNPGDAVLALRELGVTRQTDEDLERTVLAAANNPAAMALAGSKVLCYENAVDSQERRRAMETVLAALEKTLDQYKQHEVFEHLRAFALKALGREKEAQVAEEAAAQRAAQAARSSGEDNEEDDGAGDAELEKLLEHARRCTYYTSGSDEVAPAYLRVLARDPLSLEAPGEITDFFRGRGEYERGIGFWQTAIGTIPNEVQPYLGLAWLHVAEWDATQRHVDISRGVKAFESAFARSKADTWLRLVAANALADRAVALDKAREWVGRAQRIAGDTPQTLYSLGWSLSQAGEHQEAQTMLLKARERMTRPKGQDVRFRRQIDSALADTYLRQGYVEEARGLFQESGDHQRPVELHVGKGNQRVVWCGARVLTCMQGDAPAWTFTSPSPGLSSGVSDITGDGVAEYLLGTGEEGTDPGTVFAVSQSGKRLWRFRLGVKGPYWPDDNYRVRGFRCGDVDADGRTEVVTWGDHADYFPSRLCVLDAHGLLKGDQWHPGPIRDAAMGKVGGRPAIVFCGGSNNLGYRQIVACVDSRQVRGQAPKSLDEVGKYPGLWYKVLPSAVHPELAMHVEIQGNEVRVLSDKRQVVMVLDGSNGKELQNLLAKEGEGSESHTSGPAEKWALCVGIDAYPPESHLPPLQYAVADASAVAKSLREYCEFPASRVQVLTNAQATRAAIKGALLKSVDEATDLDGILVVFFAGHGFVDRKDPDHRGFVQPYDAAGPQNPQQALAVDEINDILGRARSARVVLILDSCHSGAGSFTVHSMRRLNEIWSRQPGHVMLTSCGAEEVSGENAKVGHGVFTYYLLEALRPENWKMDPNCLRVTDLHSYLSWRMDPGHMRSEFGPATRPQTPCLVGNAPSDMILCRRTVKRTARGL